MARGKQPKKERTVAVAETTEPPDYNKATPKFCLNHLAREHCVESLPESRRADFAMALQLRASMTWGDILLASRHGLGSELLPAARIKPSIPRAFEDSDRFLVLRYSGLLPMVGVRVRDVFHIIWLEGSFGDIYDH